MTSGSMLPLALMSGSEGYEILARLCDQIDHEGCITVVDLMRLMKVEAIPAQYLFGWTSIEDFQVKKSRTGRYELIVPDFQLLVKNGQE